MPVYSLAASTVRYASAGMAAGIERQTDVTRREPGLRRVSRGYRDGGCLGGAGRERLRWRSTALSLDPGLPGRQRVRTRETASSSTRGKDRAWPGLT